MGQVVFGWMWASERKVSFLVIRRAVFIMFVLMPFVAW